MAGVNALQDQIAVGAQSSRTLVMPDYDTASFDTTREALLELAKHMGRFDHALGAETEVDSLPHMVGMAAGWGGRPDREARYGRLLDIPGPRRSVE